LFIQFLAYHSSLVKLKHQSIFLQLFEHCTAIISRYFVLLYLIF